jgi:hypothetical protein
LGRNFSINSVIEEWTPFKGGTPLCGWRGLRRAGQSPKELCLSVETISSYRNNILLKMKMKYNAEITHYAIQKKLVD